MHAPAAVHDSYTRSVEALIRNLVHDLRQPLSTIQNCACYLDIITRNGPAPVRDHIDIIERQVQEADTLLIEVLAAVGRLTAQAGEEAEASRELTNSVTAVLT